MKLAAWTECCVQGRTPAAPAVVCRHSTTTQLPLAWGPCTAARPLCTCQAAVMTWSCVVILRCSQRLHRQRLPSRDLASSVRAGEATPHPGLHCETVAVRSLCGTTSPPRPLAACAAPAVASSTQGLNPAGSLTETGINVLHESQMFSMTLGMLSLFPEAFQFPSPGSIRGVAV